MATTLIAPYYSSPHQRELFMNF